MQTCTQTLKYAVVALFAVLAYPAEAQELSDFERMQIERDCTQLEFNYAAGLDNFDADGFAGLFTETATMDLFQNHFPGMEASPQHLSGGRDAMHAYMVQRGSREERMGTAQTVHLITNMQIEIIDSSHARGRGFETMFRYDPREPGTPATLTPVLLGWIESDYVRTGAGWKFQARTLRAIGPF